jgi:hypothetical protein
MAYKRGCICHVSNMAERKCSKGKQRSELHADEYPTKRNSGIEKRAMDWGKSRKKQRKRCQCNMEHALQRLSAPSSGCMPMHMETESHSPIHFISGQYGKVHDSAERVLLIQTAPNRVLPLGTNTNPFCLCISPELVHVCLLLMQQHFNPDTIRTDKGSIQLSRSSQFTQAHTG